MVVMFFGLLCVNICQKLMVFYSAEFCESVGFDGEDDLLQCRSALWLSLSFCSSVAKSVCWIAVLVVSASCQLWDSGMSKKEEDYITTRIRIMETKIDDGEVTAAQYELEPLLRSYPDNDKLLTLSGFIHISLRNYSRAIEEMKKAYALNPSPSAALNMSASYIAAQQFDKALEVIDRGIEMHEDQPYAYLGRLHHNRGYVFELTKRYQQAIESYKQALYHSPSFMLTLSRIAATYDRVNNKPAAIDAYKRWSYVCSSCFIPLEKLALYYIASPDPGDHDVARKMVASYLKNKQVLEKDKAKAENLWRHISSRRKPSPLHLSNKPLSNKPLSNKP